MNQELAQLKDIHLPEAISMWPLAPGFLVLLFLLLAAFCFALYFWQKKRRKKYTIKFALAKLENLQQLIQENPEINVTAEISTLLRRTALHYFRREEIAGLVGKEWLHFLNYSGQTSEFTHEIGHLLTDAPYCKKNVNDVTPLFSLARNWLMTISKEK